MARVLTMMLRMVVQRNRTIFYLGLQLCSALVLGIVFGASSGIGDEWSEFRGPNQNGTCASGSLPLEWDKSKNVRWFTSTEGLGWSSPVVYKGRVYFTSAINRDSQDSSSLKGSQSLELVCLDATNGTTLFSKEIFSQGTDAPGIHGKNSHASPTLVIANDRIYVHFGHQGTACTDLMGEKIWENRDHAYPPTHGNGGSPIIVGGNLIVTCDGGNDPYTLALDLETGKEVWRTLRDVTTDRSFSFCTPQFIVADGVEQIISPGSAIVQSLAPSDGAVLWSVTHDGFSVIPRPVYHRGLVFVCTGYMAPKLLAIDPRGRGDVTKSHVKWVNSTSVPNTPSIIATDNQIIMVNDAGIATSIDIESGSEQWRMRIGGNYSASPLLAGQQLYFQSEQGDGVVMQMSDDPKKKPEQIAKNSLPGRIFASYAVIENDLIIRTETGIYRIGNP